MSSRFRRGKPNWLLDTILNISLLCYLECSRANLGVYLIDFEIIVFIH